MVLNFFIYSVYPLTFKSVTPVVLYAIIKMGRVSRTQHMNILLLRSFIYIAYFKGKNNCMLISYIVYVPRPGHSSTS